MLVYISGPALVGIVQGQNNGFYGARCRVPVNDVSAGSCFH